MDFSRASWRKSSLSTQNGSCVEIAEITDGKGASGYLVGVRDSKDPDGPVLTFAPGCWRAFTDQVKAGAFDLI